MMKYFALTAAAGIMAQEYQYAAPAQEFSSEWAAPSNVASVATGPNPAPAMDPMMMMMLMGDKGGMKDMLPLMMMTGGLNGSGAPMDPMMLMMLMGDDSSSMKDMLPLMMMNGSGGQMDPMMMMTLMGDDAGSMKDLLPLMMMNGGAAGGAPMDPMMMMMMMGDDSSSMKDMLPLMMMQGGANGAAPMDPMMMMTLMGDDSGSMKDLLPLMMMQGGEAGAMNPMMLMSLLEDSSCEISNEELKALDLSAEDAEAVATGKKIWNGSEVVDASTAQVNADFLNFIDYSVIACKAKDSGMGDLLPLMMQGGQQMDPMMMMSLMEGGDMSEMLPLMMMQGGEAGAMNPMMMMSMMGDKDSSKDGCNKKFKLTGFEATEDNGEFTLNAITEGADVQAFFEANTGLVAAYDTCLADATSQESTSSSGMKDLLPLMMMNQQPGQAMDPMMMMMLME